MSLFTGTVDYYQLYRPAIPESVAEVLDAATTKGSLRKVLDIGTGTGLVLQALLGRFDDMIGVDNDPDMLAAADEALRIALPEGALLSLVEAAAEDFTTPSGWKADLVTICRAFHWIVDESAFLARLDAHVAPGGTVAIFGDNSFWVASSPWKEAVRALIKDFLGEERRAGSGTFKHHSRPYSGILEESTFSQVEELTVPVEPTWTVDTILGYLYSTTFAAPNLFGDRLTEFETRSGPPSPSTTQPAIPRNRTSS